MSGKSGGPKTEVRSQCFNDKKPFKKQKLVVEKLLIAIFFFFISIKKKVAFKFENLVIWQKAVDLSDLVNTVAKTFPKNELFILTTQIKRAADSVSLNIAEGSTGQSNPEFKRFLGYAIRSNIEVLGCIFLAQRRGIILQQDFEKIYKLCEDILLMTSSLRNKL